MSSVLEDITEGAGDFISDNPWAIPLAFMGAPSIAAAAGMGSAAGGGLAAGLGEAALGDAVLGGGLASIAEPTAGLFGSALAPEAVAASSALTPAFASGAVTPAAVPTSQFLAPGMGGELGMGISPGALNSAMPVPGGLQTSMTIDPLEAMQYGSLLGAGGGQPEQMPSAGGGAKPGQMQQVSFMGAAPVNQYTQLQPTAGILDEIQRYMMG